MLLVKHRSSIPYGVEQGVVLLFLRLVLYANGTSKCYDSSGCAPFGPGGGGDLNNLYRCWLYNASCKLSKIEAIHVPLGKEHFIISPEVGLWNLCHNQCLGIKFIMLVMPASFVKVHCSLEMSHAKD